MSEQFADLIEPVARFLLGEPNKALSSAHELRYGSRGSLSVDLRKGTWHDHELGAGGGLLDLITRETKCEGSARFEWLHEHGFDVEGNRPANGKARATIVETYDYCDEAGTVLFQVVRLDPKDFRQRKPDGNGGWSWSVRGVRQVPYKLPDLEEELAQHRRVFIVEGERDVNNLRRHNLPATTNAGGAGKWRPELSEHFSGAEVVILPDRDPPKRHPKTNEIMLHPDGRPVLPGQDHAQAIAAELTGIASTVKVLELWHHWPEMPLKGDVSDWLAAGGSVETLNALVEQTPEWAPGPGATPDLLPLINIRKWYGTTPRPRQWAVIDRIPDVNVSLVTGPGGVGKTLLMQQLSVATVLGRDWLGVVPEPGPVLFITAEDDEDELHFRYDRIAESYGTDFNKLADAGLNVFSLAGSKDSEIAVADARGKVKTTALFDRIVRTAREIRPRWIGLDTAADLFLINERDRMQVRQCIALLRGIALENSLRGDTARASEPRGDEIGKRLSGSTAWNNSVRSRLYLKTDTKAQKKSAAEEEEEGEEIDVGAPRILEFMKSNYSALAASIKLKWRNGLLVPDTLPVLSPMDTAALDERARTMFMELLRRFNRQDIPVSRKDQANNYAPTVFADDPEGLALHPTKGLRRKLYRIALNYLLAKEKITIGRGPMSEYKSKRTECLYAAPTLV